MPLNKHSANTRFLMTVAKCDKPSTAAGPKLQAASSGGLPVEPSCPMTLESQCGGAWEGQNGARRGRIWNRGTEQLEESRINVSNTAKYPIALPRLYLASWLHNQPTFSTCRSIISMVECANNGTYEAGSYSFLFRRWTQNDQPNVSE